MITPCQFTPRSRLLEVMRQAGDPTLINLAAGLPSSACIPQQALAAAFAAALQDEPEVALGYQTPDGDYGLRYLLCRRLAQRGIIANPEDLVLTTGCTQALHGMIRLLAGPDDIVAAECPAYYASLEIISEIGARVLPVPVSDQDGIDLDLVEVLFARYRPKVFVLCSTLSNPSSATLPNENRRRLLEICRRTGTRLLEDEIYGELVDDQAIRPIRSWDDGSTVSYVTSFSKTVAPGIRVGVCLPGGNTDAFALLKSQQDMHSATVCEVSFRKFLEQNGLDQHLASIRAFNRRRRELARQVIAQAFPVAAMVWPSAGGFLLWVEMPEQVDEAMIYERALAEKVAFCRGAAFYAGSEGRRGAMRLNCSRVTENELVRGLEVLGHLLTA